MKINAHFKHLFQSRHLAKKFKPLSKCPETYYLIDFENVHEDGLTCSKRLTKHDHIHIFSTTNAPKISIEKLAAFNFAKLFSHVIPAGKQSLDMHLVSFLGYLIGSNSNNMCKYIIISKDTDYDNIVAFFKTLSSVKITRQNSMMEALALKPAIANNHFINSKKSQTNNIVSNVKPTSANKNTSSSKKTSTNKNTSSAKQTSGNNNTSNAKQVSANNNVAKKAASQPKNRTLLNSSIQKAVSKAGYDDPIPNKVASIAIKHYGESNIAGNVHNELRTVYPEHYLNIYKIIKPILNGVSLTNSVNQVDNTASITQAAPAQPDNTIQTILNNANYNNDTISYVISLVAKYKNDKTSKQKIYTDITKKYGQAKGLKIYNRIKKKL